MAGSSKKAIYAALVGNSLIAVTKFAAAAFTGSAAMFAEGIHSLVDTGNQILLLYGLRAARRPASPSFPFGHGKEIYFWSFVVAIMIFALGAALSFYKGLQHVLHPETLSSLGINYVVLGLAIVFEGAALTIALREFNRSKGNLGYLDAVHRGKDPTLFVIVFEDSAALLGLLVAMAGIFLYQITGNPIFDGLASMVIGLILAITAVWLAYETKSLLIGEAADPETVRRIREVAASHPLVKTVSEVATLHMGPAFVVVNISVDFVDDINVGQVEAGVTDLGRRIKAIHPALRRVFVEV
ncbi:MAG: cation diffusion facilitator family transporter, partial [Gammaproteobacteria bacterium]